MDIGYYSDKGIPPNNNAEGIKVNSLGYDADIPNFKEPSCKNLAEGISIKPVLP